MGTTVPSPLAATGATAAGAATVKDLGVKGATGAGAAARRTATPASAGAPRRPLGRRPVTMSVSDRSSLDLQALAAAGSLPPDRIQAVMGTVAAVSAAATVGMLEEDDAAAAAAAGGEGGGGGDHGGDASAMDTATGSAMDTDGVSGGGGGGGRGKDAPAAADRDAAAAAAAVAAAQAAGNGHPRIGGSATRANVGPVGGPAVAAWGIDRPPPVGYRGLPAPVPVGGGRTGYGGGGNRLSVRSSLV